ncbi:MAG: hypothetical protein ISR65_17320 [Bacteriovoracaceae bacterium]|nr:hypothetical protein [Bacteriovoracaceae bacterium]
MLPSENDKKSEKTGTHLIKSIRSKVQRKTVELVILGLLLVPIFFFINWIQQTINDPTDHELIKRVFIGIFVGVIGLGIWVLGISIIMVNILMDIKTGVNKICEKNEAENSQD